MFIQQVRLSEKNSLIDEFIRLDIENVDTPHCFFKVGILDTVARVLDENEARQYFSQPIYQVYEEDFLRFFEMAHNINGGVTYIFSPTFSNMIKTKMKKYKDGMNRKDYDCLLKQLPVKTDIFKVSNIGLLQTFVKLSVRELCLSNFFFLNSQSAIVGNYELCFPILCKNKIIFDKYCEMARRINLFIRS